MQTTCQSAINAIRSIPEIDFTPESAKQLLASIASRIANSNFKHVQSPDLDAVSAVERIDDAQYFLGDE